LKAALESLAAGLRAVGRGLREPRFYIALVLGVLLWALAYQSKPTYVVQIADLAYHPYISNFNDIETATDASHFKYRWSKADPEVFLPGIGNQPVQLSITTIGSRPGGPPPEITLTVRGQTFKLQTQPQEHTDTFTVERGDMWDGDFDLKMSVPPFSPQGDPRQLGVIIKHVEVKPADSALLPVVVPPPGTVGQLLVGMIGIYLIGLVTTRRTPFALILLAASGLLATALILSARTDLAFLAGQLPSLCAWGVLFALLGRAVLDQLMSSEYRVPSAESGVKALGTRYLVLGTHFVAAAGSASFVLAFMVRFGGLTSAQFLTSDLFLHIHNTEAVMRGTWLFSEPVPDGTLVPYPPAHYALVAALSGLMGSSEETLGLLLKWTASVLDASTCLALAWAGWRLIPGALGGFAALAYAFSPAAFDLFSAGNYTNIFAQSVLNLTLLGGLVFLDDRRWAIGPEPAKDGRKRDGTVVHRLSSIVLLTAGFALTMLGHYGMMLGTLGILAFFVVWTLYSALRGRPTGRAKWLLASAGAALAGSFAIYYWHFLGEIWNQWTGVLAKLTGNSTSQRGPAAAQTGVLQSLPKLPGKVFDLMGGLLVIVGAFGAGLAWHISAPARALLASWVLAAIVFALLDQVVGDSVRWYYLGAAPLGLLAGRFMGSLSGRHSWARALVILVLCAMALYMLDFWVNLIYTRYH
jgi:hypothetical protein